MVPKHEIIHQAGQQVPSELKEGLLRHFKQVDIQKLERLGGKVSIAITSPYVKKPSKDKQQVHVDADFVKRLHDLSKAPDKLKLQLGELPARQLRELATLIGQPIKSDANATEMRAELLGYLQAQDVWQRISRTPSDK